MGMFSEILHESFASDLLVVLNEAINSKDENIIEFTKKNIFPLWENEMGDVYRSHTEDENYIINFYKNFGKIKSKSYLYFLNKKTK